MWSDEKVSKLEGMWKETDLSCEAIGHKLGVSRNSVSGKANRLWGPHARSKVAYRKPHLPWPQEELDILLGMLRAGYSNVEIGQKIGKSRHAVKHKVKALGLATYRPSVMRRSRPAPSAQQIKVCWQPIPDTQPIHITKLTAFRCPWPLWTDVPSFMYCGQPKDWKETYCSHHFAIGTKPKEGWTA